MNSANPCVLISPATRGLSLALARRYLRNTDFPVFASYRTGNPEDVKQHILAGTRADPDRLKLLKLDLTSEQSIASAADTLASGLDDYGYWDSYIDTAFITGGVLHPEKRPSDLEYEALRNTFQINVISHLLMIKHFSQFLPVRKRGHNSDLAKWVHVTARVGSIADNRKGGWYSYRASKAALNQVIKTFDLQLQMNKVNAMCVGVHPGTVKTELSKGFWDNADEEGLFEPDESAEKLVDVVRQLRPEQRGRVWDWAGKEVPG